MSGKRSPHHPARKVARLAGLEPEIGSSGSHLDGRLGDEAVLERVLDTIGMVSTAPAQSRDVFTDLAKVGTVLNS